MESDLKKLLEEWEINKEAIDCFLNCGITTINLLKIMHSCDISQIFSEKHLLHQKIIFRHHLQKWRLQNNLQLLSCCGSDVTLTNSSKSAEKVESWLEESNAMNLDLKTILSGHVAGRDLLNYYAIHGVLLDKHQTEITRTIVDHFLIRNIKMTPELMKYGAKCVVELFPTEASATYYIPRCSNKKPQGKIFDRYFNTYQRRNTATASKKSKIDTEDSDLPVLENKPELLSKQIFLKHNVPSNLIQIWKETCSLRMQQGRDSLDDIFSNWPRYKDPNGLELIHIDFIWLYPNQEYNIFGKFLNFEALMMNEIFPAFLKDKLNLHIFNELKSATLKTDTKHFHFFNLLHAVVLPPRISKIIKPTISESQRDMILHINNINDLQQNLDVLTEEALKEKSSIQAKVIAVGNISDLREFYIYINGIIYKVPSLLAAIEGIIK